MKKVLLTIAIAAFTSSAFAQTKETVIGCWMMNSRPGEALQINRSGYFTFQDYNGKTRAFESLSGNWTLSGKTVSLMYEDRPRQRFTLSKAEGGWVLSKAGGFKLGKAQPADCDVAE